jgi:hypothetical protein
MRKVSLSVALRLALAAGWALPEQALADPPPEAKACPYPNEPVVRSSLSGGLYARSVPHDRCGERGTTKIFKVRHGQDELVAEFPVYMKEEIFLEGNDRFGYSIVHLQRKYPAHAEDYTWLGKIEKVDFYFNGFLVKCIELKI